MQNGFHGQYWWFRGQCGLYFNCGKLYTIRLRYGDTTCFFTCHIMNMKIILCWYYKYVVSQWNTSSGTMWEAHSGKLLATPNHAQQCWGRPSGPNMVFLKTCINIHQSTYPRSNLLATKIKGSSYSLWWEKGENQVGLTLVRCWW